MPRWTTPNGQLKYVHWYCYIKIWLLNVWYETSTWNRAGVWEPHANSGHTKEPQSIIVADAKLNNIVYFLYTWPTVFTVQTHRDGWVCPGLEIKSRSMLLSWENITFPAKKQKPAHNYNPCSKTKILPPIFDISHRDTIGPQFYAIVSFTQSG